MEYGIWIESLLDDVDLAAITLAYAVGCIIDYSMRGVSEMIEAMPERRRCGATLQHQRAVAFSSAADEFGAGGRPPCGVIQ